MLKTENSIIFFRGAIFALKDLARDINNVKTNIIYSKLNNSETVYLKKKYE